MQKPTDLQLEIEIARMLLVGIVVSALVVVLGGALAFHDTSLIVPDYTHFHPMTGSLSSIESIVQGALHLRADAVIQLGLLLLVATPVARVVLCVVGFARQRDRLYVAVSSTVLMILIYSLVRGRL
jgi:uncharacterized membrane protein